MQTANNTSKEGSSSCEQKDAVVANPKRDAFLALKDKGQLWLKYIDAVTVKKKDSSSKTDLDIWDSEEKVKVMLLRKDDDTALLDACKLFTDEQRALAAQDDSWIVRWMTADSLRIGASRYQLSAKDICEFLRLHSKPKIVEERVFKLVRDNAVSAAPAPEDKAGEYSYIADKSAPPLAIGIKKTTKLRPHQKEALLTMYPPSRPGIALSAVFEMPCGAGKTLTGVTAACVMQKSALVMCNNATSVSHWKSEFLRFSTLNESSVTCCTSSSKDKLFTGGGVLITTYSMLMGPAKDGISQSSQLVKTIKNRTWGLVILDEVHHIPANGTSVMLGSINAKCKLGLTGTLNREDGKIPLVEKLVGPCTYRVSLQSLKDEKLLANIVCKQINCEMTPEFLRAYSTISTRAKHRPRTALTVLNPIKFMTCEKLIKEHEAKGDKILVFVDNKFEIEIYAKTLNRPYIQGETSSSERNEVYEQFQQEHSKINTIFLTRTGDESLNLPIANIVIQTSFHHGASNQEVQRLGRIMRAKTKDGVFYSLVSNNTQEVLYAAKRRKLVFGDGYVYTDEASCIDNPFDYHFSSTAERVKLMEMIQNHFQFALDDSLYEGHRALTQKRISAIGKGKSAAEAESASDLDDDDEEIVAQEQKPLPKRKRPLRKQDQAKVEENKDSPSPNKKIKLEDSSSEKPEQDKPEMLDLTETADELQDRRDKPAATSLPFEDGSDDYEEDDDDAEYAPSVECDIDYDS